MSLTSSTAPALTSQAISVGAMPHSSDSRARRAAGSSGSAAASFSTHSSSGAIGTRSGSGKYR